MAARPPEKDFLLSRLEDFKCKCLWIGPALSLDAEVIFRSSFGSFIIDQAYALCATELLYLAVSHIFMSTWSTGAKNKGFSLKEHFYYGANYCLELLNDQQSLEKLRQINIENKAYKTAYYIGPPAGTGLAWTENFDRFGGKILQAHNYGQCAHGPLVTVDAQVEEKYVKLRPKEQMVQRYGKKQVVTWEKVYLQEKDMDDFLAQPPQELPLSAQRPFFARGSWFLPVIREAYRTEKDNLIILDLTNERHFARALDELSTFGCRFARLAVISQEAYQKNGKLKGIYKYPLSNVFLLPALQTDDQCIPVSELILPLVMNILGMLLAAGE